jgi:nitrate reductase delta subunit
MLRSLRKTDAQREAAQRVKRWTRERFELPPDAVVFVSEMACGLPGCPPLETVVAFWSAADTRHHFKVFKPLAEVIEEDLPPSWLKNALIVGDDVSSDCC